MPVAKGIDEGGESRGWMTPAGVIEMIPLERWRPVRQNFVQLTAVTILPDEVSRHIRQPRPIESGIDRRPYVAHYELAFHTYAELAAILFKLPGIESA